MGLLAMIMTAGEVVAAVSALAEVAEPLAEQALENVDMDAVADQAKRPRMLRLTLREMRQIEPRALSTMPPRP